MAEKGADNRKEKTSHRIRYGSLIVMLAVLILGIVYLHGMVQRSEEKAPASQSETPGAGQETTILESIEDLKAGQILDAASLDLNDPDKYFTSSQLTEEQKEDMKGKSYIDNPDISYDDLSYLKVLHYNYEHEIQVGEIVVNTKVAEDCRQIFLELFQEGYEIHSMYRIDRFYGDDTTRDAEQADLDPINQDNTSAFHYRKIAGTNVTSEHAYGMAIDINPLENPYVPANDVTAAGASPYLQYDLYKDRSNLRPHMITHEDICYQIFTRHGFTWGGDWKGTKDYQHFEKEM